MKHSRSKNGVIFLTVGIAAVMAMILLGEAPVKATPAESAAKRFPMPLWIADSLSDADTSSVLGGLDSLEIVNMTEKVSSHLDSLNRGDLKKQLAEIGLEQFLKTNSDRLDSLGLTGILDDSMQGAGAQTQGLDSLELTERISRHLELTNRGDLKNQLEEMGLEQFLKANSDRLDSLGLTGILGDSMQGVGGQMHGVDSLELTKRISRHLDSINRGDMKNMLEHMGLDAFCEALDSAHLAELGILPFLEKTAPQDTLIALSEAELDSLSRLSETHWIDTLIFATPKDIPARPNEIDLKTNLLMNALASPSLALEFGLADRWTMEAGGSYNAWRMPWESQWKHWMAYLGCRFWLEDREKGHFFGVHTLGGEYNLEDIRLPYNAYSSLEDNRFEGWGVGAGLSYGYRWNFNERWGIEAELGIGYLYSEYDKYESVSCSGCGERLAWGKHHYIGPTKAGVSLIYRFGKAKREAYKKAIEPRPVPLIRERIIRDTIRLTDIQIQKDTLVRVDTLVHKDTVKVQAPKPVVSNLDYTLNIEFKSGSTMYQSSLGKNEQEMQKFLSVIDSLVQNKNITINSVQVIGYASIDGAEQTNLRLSQQRAQGVANYLRSKYPDLRGKVTSEGRGEDWDGLLKYIEESIGLEGKDEAAYIIRTVDMNAGRERRIMSLNGGRFYRTISQEIFPKLRRIECKIGFTEIRMGTTGETTIVQ